ncbi:hypothetical protein PYJP_06110 [Pyrofollis japonicus]|uniref:hypothetical protein n=1 Tax=Pyrofollis japonicus TaxID=3060460 RepID=UPI00295A6F1A|nr:hypothetical protein [Pyrofollis japonicus]BEP17259.1 hypothetical protein PYJP_06110 [Pyrofollis japonicus]
MPLKPVRIARERMKPIIVKAIRVYKEKRDERALDVLARYLLGEISREEALEKLRRLEAR